MMACMSLASLLQGIRGHTEASYKVCSGHGKVHDHEEHQTGEKSGILQNERSCRSPLLHVGWFYDILLLQ